jgi:hypothetical protein
MLAAARGFKGEHDAVLSFARGASPRAPKFARAVGMRSLQSRSNARQTSRVTLRG